MAIIFEKKQLDLIKQHHEDREKTNKNKLEYKHKIKGGLVLKILNWYNAGAK